jgi:hypothetical protein
VEKKQIEGMMELYLLELSQDRYRPQMLKGMRNVRKARRQKERQDSALLDRLNQMTVPDEDLPPPPTKGKRTRR